MVKYLLDSNVFIEAHRKHYPFDVVPSFWNRLIDLSNNDSILSIDKVKKELCENSSTVDELGRWCLSTVKEDFFVDSTSCIDKYAELANWAAASMHYSQGAIDEFLTTDLADPWLIAYAIKNNCVIVTHEVSNPSIKKKIKIPEPCNHFGVRFISTIAMFRELSVIL